MFLCSVATFLLNVAVLAQTSLATVAEKTDWQQTGRFSETIELCRTFAETFPDRVRCESFGRSPEGRPLLALIASDDGVVTPELARRRGRLVLLVQGGIHAGEICGKDAGFALLRDLLRGKEGFGLLAKVTLVFVPVLNVDGHERFGPNHRVNQNGPVETGWRTTAQNLNLNRDYAKVEAPEMAALLSLLATWDPLVYVDLHSTDGVDFQPDMALIVLPGPEEPLHRELAKAARTLERRAEELMAPRVQAIVGFYPAFRSYGDPTSGFEVYHPAPRFSHAYWSVRHRLGVLVETHALKPYAVRVRASREAVLATLRLTAEHGRTWRAAAQKADRTAKQLAGKKVALAFKATEKHETLAFPGVAYDTRLSEVSGTLWVQYRTGEPTTWRLPYYKDLQPSLSVIAPSGGYLVPPAHAEWLARKLDLHGIEYHRVEQAQASAPVELFRATEVTFAKGSFEGRQRLTLQGTWRAAERPIAAGTLFVPIAQARAELVMHLLEPQAPDSLAQWGFFNAAFEQKEYMENYIAELEARRMMKADPKLRAAFMARVASDPEFAKSPRARLTFFYERHPAYDTRLNLYPILRSR